MTRDWHALAAAIKAVRKRLGMTQVQLADAAEASASTIQKLESGNGEKIWEDLPDSLPRVERALGWEAGTAEAILHGAEAPPLPRGPVRKDVPQPAAPADGPALSEGMPLRVRNELAGGRAVVEATVVEGTGDSRFVVVWTAGTDVNPDEITPEELEQWTRLNRAAHGLPRGSDPDA